MMRGSDIENKTIAEIEKKVHDKEALISLIKSVCIFLTVISSAYTFISDFIIRIIDSRWTYIISAAVAGLIAYFIVKGFRKKETV